jgi:hypothetical protein
MRFPFMPRLLQVAAAAAAVLAVLLMVPRGPVRWERTEVVRLDTVRSGEGAPSPTSFDVDAVRDLCAELQNAVTAVYRAGAGREGPVWRMGITVTEFANGALEVRIRGEPGEEGLEPLEIRQVFDDVAALAGELKALEAAVLRKMGADGYEEVGTTDGHG